MADEKTKPIYKYIDIDLNADALLSNLKHNAQSYVQFNNWDESKAREFYAALDQYEQALSEGRLSSNQAGNIVDSKGILDNGAADWRDKQGNVLSQEQYESLSNRKKRKVSKDFYANRWVANYIDNIAQSMAKKLRENPEKPAEKPKFDFAKNGVWSGFVLSMAPNGNGDLKAWWDTDPVDAKTKKRATTNRANLLNKYITDYIANLPENLDFSETTFKNRDAYLQRLQDLQAELANGIDTTDFRLLNTLGGNPDEYRAFFTTDESYNPEEPASAQSGEQPAAQQATDPEATKRLNTLDNQYKTTFNSAHYKQYRLTNGQKPTGVKYDATAADKLTAYMNALNKANISFSVSDLQHTDGRAYTNYLEQYGEMNPKAVQRVAVGNYAGWMYIPESLNQSDFSVLAYNPSTHHVGRLFYGSLGAQARQDYADILRQIDSWNQQSGQPLFQEGGTISILDQISSGTGAVAQFDQLQKGQSQKTKSDPKNRQPWAEDNNYSSNEFTANDYARLGAIAADIAALIDPEPFSALGLGVASDVTNLVADINEGQGFWNTAGNFAANLGLSAVGMIPIFGDSVGSGGKIVKNLVKFAPKITKYLAGAGLLAGLSNSDEIIKSFSKIGKDGPENEMNMQDWRNIGIGIQLVLGGTNMAKNSKTVKRLNQKGKSDMVDAVVVDKTTGKKKVLRFGDKEDVEALRNAKTTDDANAVINKHNSLKGKYEIATQEGKSVTWFGENSKWYKPWSWRQTTKTTGIKDGAIRSAVDYQKIRDTAKKGSFRRSEWIAGHDYPGWRPSNTPEIIKSGPLAVIPQPVNPVNPIVTPINPVNPRQIVVLPSTGQQYYLPTSVPQNRLALPGEARQTIEAARQFRRRQTTPTTRVFFSDGNVVIPAQTMLPNGGGFMLKKGGKLARLRRIAKAQDGLNSDSFKLQTPTLNFPQRKNSLGMPIKVTRNYGTGYTPKNTDTPDYYSNGEYGTQNPVNISAIKAANAGRRASTLHPQHGAGTYNYSDAQANTTAARTAWQGSDNTSRIADFTTWARNWYKENPNGTQADMLNAYNTAIDSMYEFKHQMGTADYTGDKSYRKDDAVGAFNRTNRAVYSSANDPNNGNAVNGYDEGSENVNGTTTAQRFIDITDKDVTDLDFSNSFQDSDTEGFRNLFTGLAKDQTGRYYSLQDELDWEALKNTPPVSSPETPEEPETNPEDSETEKVQVNPNTKKRKRHTLNLSGLLQDMAPNALAVGRYLNTRHLNSQLLDIARQMPVMLYDPKERLRWIEGDEGAIQRGRRAAGTLSHMAATPITADGNQQTAAQMEALLRGLDYINQGYQQNDQRVQTTREANWTQEGLNQDSRYQNAMKNRENLFEHRQAYLNALATHRRANYEGLNNLLGQFETQLRDRADETRDYREAVEKASLQNDISANLNDYNITATPKEQQLVNDLMTGKRKLSDLSADEKLAYERISSAVNDEVTRRIADSYGASYRPFRLNTPTTFTGTGIRTDKNGGVLYGDSEKVVIQKLRGKLQRMKTQQRNLEARLNAFEKDMDRAQRGSAQYIRGQKKK